MKYIIIIAFALASASCNSQKKKVVDNEIDFLKIDNNSSQIGEYVVKVFEDSRGNLWFGTLEKGVAKYDGKSLNYIAQDDGLPSNRVTAITEDDSGNLWFGTEFGIVRFGGKDYVNYSVKDGLCHNSISNLFFDSKGNLWIGTWGGVCFFDGKEFNNVNIPYPKVDSYINPDTKDWITDIKEDPDGNVWISRDGYGVCKYDGESFTYILKSDGLLSNNVTEIEFDEDGGIWFGSRVGEKDNPNQLNRNGNGGVNLFTEKGIKNFPQIEAFNSNEVYEIFKDRQKHIWICTVKSGVYRFDGDKFNHYDVPISVMSMIEDKNGIFWLGGAGGLYKINHKKEIINVMTDGPWE